MDLYVLDSLLRRIAVVDNYESLIWTERFSASGDFELKLSSSLGSRNLFTAGTRLNINGSTRVMTVEAVQDATDTDGKDVLTISGPSLETILEDRAAFNYGQDYTTAPAWVLTGTAAAISRQMFDTVCRTATANPADRIPFLQAGSLYVPSTMPEPTTSLHIDQTPTTLYSAIKELCDGNELGFRLVRSPVNNLLYFDIYAGNDRTSRQTTLNPVIFSAAMDDLQNTTELSTVQGSKNVAYVYSPLGFEVVYGDHTPTDIDGFDRRVLLVDGNSVTSDNPDIAGSLIALGQAALMAARPSSLFDGEVNQHSQFMYEQDYFVGDLVEVRNKDGIVTYKRVTEQIFSSDQNGERSYPTLSADLFAGTNDWLAYDSDPKAWIDYDSLSTAWTDM